MSMDDDRPLSTGDDARLLHVTPVCVLRWVRAGKLPAYRVPGGHFRIARAQFRKFLADNQIPVALDGPPGRRILVVDDEEGARDAFEAALTARGYTVVLARDGREALRIIRRERFDLIFLDALLPTVGGTPLLESIKRRDPEAVIVLLAAQPQHARTLAALKYGPAMLLPKPAKVSDMYAVLKMVFNERMAGRPELGRWGEAARAKSPAALQTRGTRR
jgi:excisionase family DNA binding protein